MSAPDVWTLGPNQVSVTADAVISAVEARQLANQLREAADEADREAGTTAAGMSRELDRLMRPGQHHGRS